MYKERVVGYIILYNVIGYQTIIRLASKTAIANNVTCNLSPVESGFVEGFVLQPVCEISSLLFYYDHIYINNLLADTRYSKSRYKCK